MDLDQMRTQVRTMVRDEVGAFITTEDIDVWLNEAQRDLAGRLRDLQKNVGGVVAADSTVAFPPDLLSVHSFSVAGLEASFVNDDVFASWDESGAIPPAVMYRIFGPAIISYPDQTGQPYSLDYEYEPADLISAGDVSGLPLSLHVKMVQYARAMAALKEQSGDSGQYMALYEMGLPEVSTAAARRIATPISMSFSFGPFDTADAKHI